MLDMTWLPADPQHCAAAKPLAEAVTRVAGMQARHVSSMAGWRVRGLKLPDTISRLSTIGHLVRGVTGLHVEALVVGLHDWQELAEGGLAQATVAVRQLCDGLQGVRHAALP